MKWHAQVCKARKNSDGTRSIIRGLCSDTQQVVIDADGLTAARAAVERVIMDLPGEWMMDGYPLLRGGTHGETRIG